MLAVKKQIERHGYQLCINFATFEFFYASDVWQRKVLSTFLAAPIIKIAFSKFQNLYFKRNVPIFMILSIDIWLFHRNLRQFLEKTTFSLCLSSVVSTYSTQVNRGRKERPKKWNNSKIFGFLQQKWGKLKFCPKSRIQTQFVV